jgi:adenylate kinase
MIVRMKRIYLLIGAPGSGKTSTMETIKDLKISHYSIGSMYRKLSEENSILGIEIKSYIDKGQIVPISIAQKVIEHFVNKGKELIVIDGFPRNMEQAIMFDKAINKKAELSGVIELMVDEREAINRIAKRARGKDDDPSLFKERIRVYNEEIREIRKYYQTQNKYISIESKTAITDTAEKIKSIIAAKINAK